VTYPGGGAYIRKARLASEEGFFQLHRLIQERMNKAWAECSPRRAEPSPQPQWPVTPGAFVLNLRNRPTPALADPIPNSFYYPRGSKWVTVVLFFSTEGVRRWREQKAVRFPDCCCRCLNAAEVRKHLQNPGWLRWPWQRRVRINDVPFCEGHGRRRVPGGLRIECVYTTSYGGIGLALSVENPLFAQRLFELNTTGEMPPPWAVFPLFSPVSSGWRQGLGESWFWGSWFPFWDRLSAREQADYQERHQAPSEWREYFSLVREGPGLTSDAQ
jgi:hypothetical protein